MEPRCTLRGYLFGLICPRLQLRDLLARAEIIAVPAESDDDPIPGTGPSPSLKPVAKRVTQDEIDERLRQADFVLRAKTDERGRFCIQEPNYAGAPLDVYVVVSQVPLVENGDPQERRLDEPARLYLGAYRPTPEQQDDDQPASFSLSLLIPRAIYCRLKRLVDVWTVAGRVTVCGTDEQVPVPGVRVFALDVDWVQQDELGDAVTNGAGVFRIDYPGSRFRDGTVIDVELFGGPDYYFRIEDSDGNALLTEPPSRGRAPDRENKGPCFCVELCVRVPGPPPPGPVVWTDVGYAKFALPDASGLNGFDAQGYGVPGASSPVRYAFTGGSLKMMGGSALPTDPDVTLEYRFLVSDTPGTNGGPPVPASSFTRIVGVGADAGLFVNNVELGKVVQILPVYDAVPVRANAGDLDGDGWLDVRKAIERAFVDDPFVTPADIPAYLGDPFGGWNPDVLLAIDTRELAAPFTPGAGLAAGDPVPASDVVNPASNTFALRFEARLRNTVTNAVTPIPSSGTTLNAIVLDNTAAVRLIAVDEHAGDACAPLSGDASLSYTVYHPHLSVANINVRSNEASPVYNRNVDDANLPLSVNAAPGGVAPINASGVSVENNQQGAPPVQQLHQCTYLVRLGVAWRMHNGDSALALGDPLTTFYIES